MDTNGSDISCSDNVKIRDGKVFRHIYNTDLYKKLIDIIERNNLFDSFIVHTKLSEDENYLQHEYINAITESGEYTESMAYDTTEAALNLSIKLIDAGIYPFDLLPHNYSFHKGKWILHDFDGITLDKKRAITQIRGLLKISFSSFEITKQLNRKYLKHYYLNRIKISDLMKMIKIPDAISFSLKRILALSLYYMGLNKQAYIYLKYLLKQYKKEYKRNIYKPVYNDEDKKVCEFITKLLKSNNINSVFCCGEEGAKWAAAAAEVGSSDIFKFVYIDDYDICDSFYNYIIENNLINTSTAVLYPLVCDDNIPEQYAYRAIYDFHAQRRFKYEAAVIPDVAETLKTNQNTDEYITNISKFCTKLLILRLKQITESKLKEDFISKLKYVFEDINTFEAGSDLIIYCIKTKQNQSEEKKYERYKNSNRGVEADIQTKKLFEILNK